MDEVSLEVELEPPSFFSGKGQENQTFLMGLREGLPQDLLLHLVPVIFAEKFSSFSASSSRSVSCAFWKQSSQSQMSHHMWPDSVFP